MPNVKYYCERCGYSELPSFKDKLKSIFIEIMLFFGFLFIILLLFYFISGNGFFVQKIATASGGRLLTTFAAEHDDELRAVAINFTADCEAHSYCYASRIYNKLITLRYIPDSKNTFKIIYDPEYVLNNGGDCKNTAMLFTHLMLSVGQDSEVRCNGEHCVSYVPIKYSFDTDYEEYIIVDLAYGSFDVFNKTYDFWKEYK